LNEHGKRMKEALIAMGDEQDDSNNINDKMSDIY